MHSALSLARSLTVAVCIGFLLPVLGVSFAIIGLGIATYLPGVDWISQVGLQGLMTVLATFGSGDPLEGLMVIGAAFALVSALFDGYVTYRQRIF
jgi:hypothetical protein